MGARSGRAPADRAPWPSHISAPATRSHSRIPPVSTNAFSTPFSQKRRAAGWRARAAAREAGARAGGGTRHCQRLVVVEQHDYSARVGPVAVGDYGAVELVVLAIEQRRGVAAGLQRSAGLPQLARPQVQQQRVVAARLVEDACEQRAAQPPERFVLSEAGVHSSAGVYLSFQLTHVVATVQRA